MQMYASTAGKSGGEFYTPQEVSELLARITVVGKREVNKVYDPACGSGSLLLKFVKVLGNDKVRQGFFGQEINLTTYNLCRINMFLHDVNFENFDIAHGDTLTDPKHWDDEPFEAIVSNPPYSIKWAGDANPLLINDPRFAPAGVLAPKSKADLAFMMHILSWLAVNGTAAIVEFPGAHFTRSGNKNKLLPEHQQKILDAYTARADAPHFARLVENADIAKNGYNIAVSSYISRQDEREAVDIQALNAEIARIVARQAALRTAIDAIVAGLENSPPLEGWQAMPDGVVE